MTSVAMIKYRAVIELVFVCVIIILFSCCSSPEKQKAEEHAYRQEIADKLYRNKDEDSLRLLLQQFSEEENDFAVMLCHKQLGLYMRENARFSEAIEHHQEGLDIALKLKDTIEIVQAYNNLGTDFRRIGSQGEASEFHYRALEYAEAYSQVGVPGVGMKNRAVSLNGIGNISLTLGYLDDAEKYFRKALKDEIKLESALGQAINYANLGAIFELRVQLDSAKFYYNKSLEQNQIAKSNMGIGLCLIHLGDLHAKEKNFKQAKEEYKKAYDLMAEIADKWHWLEACISIARIHFLEKNNAEFNHYIGLAEETANQIKSPEHLADVYFLKHEYHMQRADYLQAFRNYKLHTEMKDSVYGIQRANRYMDVRMNYERDKSEREIARVEADAAEKEKRRKFTLNVLIAIVFVGGVVIGLLYYGIRQRNRSNKLLKELEQVRTDFFTNITHEFRTPLTVIQGFSRLLKNKDDLSEKEINAYLDAIGRQSNNLLNLVNQLLDITKLRSGTEKPVWKRGDIISYLRMIAETFRLYAEEKKVRLVFYSDTKELEMDFIPFYIDKIVSNLLSNAVKHTQTGDRIDFIVIKGARPDTIIVRVADTGEGIPKEDLKRIFEMFYRSENSKNTTGTGIGLSFTKMMVEKMNGEIEADSELGKGTAFTITLPLTNNSLPFIAPLKENKATHSLLSEMEKTPLEDSAEELAIDEENAEKPIVLVVEDNKDVSHYIKTLLKNKYSVIAAQNGQEGLEMAERYIPDVVVTDVMMPVKDGVQLCCEMKQNMMLNHIPVIMLTAKSDDEDRIKGLQCGAEAYINKPFFPEELFATICNLMEGRKKVIEKYKDTLENNLSGIRIKIESDTNLKYLQTVTDIILTEMQNPELSSAFIAEKMSVSQSQLSRKFSGITGQSIVSYILKVKLNAAKKMLRNPSSSITDVSDACGFNDSGYFSRVFKKQFGITPSQYQKMPE